MTIPARLYDGSSAGGTLIAHIRLSTERRAAYTPVRHKLDEGWVDRVAGEGAVEMLVRAEGMADLAWIATLYGRQDQRAAATYHVAMDDGDSHTGSFMVQELDEAGDPGDGRRRFRLTLLSKGRVIHTPAP